MLLRKVIRQFHVQFDLICVYTGAFSHLSPGIFCTHIHTQENAEILILQSRQSISQQIIPPSSRREIISLRLRGGFRVLRARKNIGMLKSTLIRINRLSQRIRFAGGELPRSQRPVKRAHRAPSNAGPIKGRKVSGGYVSFVRFEDTPLSPVPLINELRGMRPRTMPLFRNDALVMVTRP